MLESSTLQTIVLTCRLPEAEQFYGSVLGLPLKARSHGALVYDVGGADPRVSPVASMKPLEHTVVGFAVSDIRAAIANLDARGVTWERFPGFPHDQDGLVATSEGARVIWFKDPDGNILSIVQYG